MGAVLRKVVDVIALAMQGVRGNHDTAQITDLVQHAAKRVISLDFVSMSVWARTTPVACSRAYGSRPDHRL